MKWSGGAPSSVSAGCASRRTRSCACCATRRGKAPALQLARQVQEESGGGACQEQAQTAPYEVSRGEEERKGEGEEEEGEEGAK